MTTSEELNQSINYKILVKRCLQGAGLAVIYLAILRAMIGEIEEWVWLPITTVSVGGTGAGILFYFLVDFLFPKSGKKVLLTIFCVLVHFGFFWLSLIAALDQVGLWD